MEHAWCGDVIHRRPPVPEPLPRLKTLRADDQSWSVSVPAYPLLTEVGAFSQLAHSYSVADIAAIVQYALERGIRCVHATVRHARELLCMLALYEESLSLGRS